MAALLLIIVLTIRPRRNQHKGVQVGKSTIKSGLANPQIREQCNKQHVTSYPFHIPMIWDTRQKDLSNQKRPVIVRSKELLQMVQSLPLFLYFRTLHNPITNTGVDIAILQIAKVQMFLLGIRTRAAGWSDPLPTSKRYNLTLWLHNGRIRLSYFASIFDLFLSRMKISRGLECLSP